jgi:hypothetical protein
MNGEWWRWRRGTLALASHGKGTRGGERSGTRGGASSHGEQGCVHVVAVFPLFVRSHGGIFI